MRQMEKSTRDFADWRKEREKEVMQLRRQVGVWLHACLSAVLVSRGIQMRVHDLVKESPVPTVELVCICYDEARLPACQLPHWAAKHAECFACAPLVAEWLCLALSSSISHFVGNGQGRKTAAQVQRLEALHAKQQAVLRRKTEEAEAARKRLHVRSLSFALLLQPICQASDCCNGAQMQ